MWKSKKEKVLPGYRILIFCTWCFVLLHWVIRYRHEFVGFRLVFVPFFVFGQYYIASVTPSFTGAS